MSRREALTAGMLGLAGIVGMAVGAGPAGATRGPDVPGFVARHAGKQPKLWGMDLPGDTVGTFTPFGREFALTFDACGGGGGSSEANTALLDFLVSQRIPATLFLNSRWIDANPRLTDRLIANPLFEIGNHGTRHVPLSVNGRSAYHISGTHSVQEVVDEVWGNHDKLTKLIGRPPRLFRAGTAHYDEIAAAIVREIGELPVAFSVNGDAGATATAVQIRVNMALAQPGGISIGHMNQPRSQSAAGFADAVGDMRARGFSFVRLSDRLLSVQSVRSGRSVAYHLGRSLW